MRIDRTERFKRDFQRLPEPIKKTAQKQITQLLLDQNHPSLNLEKLQGYENRWSARIDRNYRMSLEKLEDGTYLLRRVLPHDDLYRNP